MQVKPAICIWLTRIVTVLAVAVAIVGCEESIPPKVVVYTSVDREIALPIFAEFTKETGIKVLEAYGSNHVESAKLAQDIVAHGAQSRADVYWNKEIFDTLWLEREGLLRPFTSPDATYFATDNRSANGTWYAVANNARVLVVNIRQIPESRRPKSIKDLTDPQWYERTAIARPTHSAAGTHAACIFLAWGDAKSQEFFLSVKRNARISRRTARSPTLLPPAASLSD
jgi:iron(III) transport system substrate-binding protein